MVHVLDEVGRFSDVELVGRLERLVRADRALSAKLLLHLGEVDARELYRELSFSSMFEYCRSGLRMSEAEAYLRILAARVGRKFPLVLERLGVGAVHLTAIKLLAPHLTAENHVQLLDRVRGMTKRNVEVLVAELAPRPDVPARMRKLPQPRASREENAAAGAASSNPALACTRSSTAATGAAACDSVLTLSTPVISMGPLAADLSSSAEPQAEQIVSGVRSSLELQPTAAPAARSGSPSAFALAPRRARATITPLSPERFDLRLTVGQEAHDALRQLVELLRHQNPSGDIAYIVERALCELAKREMKRRFGHTHATEQRVKRASAQAATPDAEATCAPATEPELEAKTECPAVAAKAKRQAGSTKSRYIPMAVRREVHARDNGQCTFVSEDGRRCTERGFLEVHHHNTTFARGGEATADNLRIMCRAHNMLLAHHDYGRAFMKNKLLEAAARTQLPLVPGQKQL